MEPKTTNNGAPAAPRARFGTAGIAPAGLEETVDWRRAEPAPAPAGKSSGKPGWLLPIIAGLVLGLAVGGAILVL
jgi:hypothetical protein